MSSPRADEGRDRVHERAGAEAHRVVGGEARLGCGAGDRGPRRVVVEMRGVEGDRNDGRATGG